MARALDRLDQQFSVAVHAARDCLFDFVTWKDRSNQRFVALASLSMIILYYYFYGSLTNSVGAGITNFMRHLVPVVGMCTILLIVARPLKPDWLPSWALTSLLTGLVAIELYIQKQLLDLFRYGLWVS